MRLFRRRAGPSYRAGVDRRERVFAITAAVEAMFLAFGALVAFLTPTERSEHNVVLSVALLGIATPLVWHSASAVFNGTSQADPLLLRVIIPNAVVLLMCSGGLLQSGTDAYGPWPALVAAVAVTIIAVAIRLTRHRLPADAQT